MGKSVLYDALLTSKSLEVDTESGRTRRKDSSYSRGAIWAPFSTKGDIATIKSADSQEKGKGKKSKKGEGKGSPQANAGKDAGKDADATASPEKEKKDKPVPKDGEKGNKNESMDQVQGELRDLRNLLNDMKGVGQPTVDEVTSAEAAKKKARAERFGIAEVPEKKGRQGGPKKFVPKYPVPKFVPEKFAARVARFG